MRIFSKFLPFHGFRVFSRGGEAENTSSFSKQTPIGGKGCNHHCKCCRDSVTCSFLSFNHILTLDRHTFISLYSCDTYFWLSQPCSRVIVCDLTMTRQRLLSGSLIVSKRERESMLINPFRNPISFTCLGREIRSTYIPSFHLQKKTFSKKTSTLCIYYKDGRVLKIPVISRESLAIFQEKKYC